MRERREVTAEELEAIKYQWSVGTPRRLIAENLNRSLNTIRCVIKRLQKRGELERRSVSAVFTEEDEQQLSSELAVPLDVVKYLISLAPRGNKQEAMARVRSLIVLWVGQKGRCYYTGVPLTTETGHHQARLLSTVGNGRVFVSTAASLFRGKLSHKAFLTMVGMVSTYSLSKTR